MPLNQLSDGNVAGTLMGQSATDKIGFFGTAPIARPTLTAVATTTATTALNETKINRLYVYLRALGLIP